jgi:tetratricopeptide (TPR) repeat protein
MKALEKDRNRRYETANGFAMDVQRYLADEPVLACPPSAAYRFRKFARRNKTGLAVAGLILFFIALLGGGGGWVMRDRAARQAKAVNDLDLALERAELFQGQGQRPEALAALERAELLSRQVPADVARDARLAAVKERLDAEARDQDFLNQFEDIRLRVASQVDVEENHFSSKAVYPEIRKALRNFGIEIGITAAAEASDRIKGRPEPIRRHLVAALDECLRWPDARAWLLAALAATDNDAWRMGVRQAWVQGDLQTLEHLAQGADVRKQPPSFLLLVAKTLPAQMGPTRLELLRRIQRSYPADLWANHDLAYELEKSGQPAEAVRYYTAALALRPDNPGIYLNRGAALRAAGEVDAAIVDVHQALALAPRYAMAHNNLGIALQAKAQVDEAIAAYREAIRLNKDYADAHNNLGNALDDKGQVDEAIGEYREALRLNKDYAEPHCGLGNVLRVKGRLDEAIAECREAIRLKKDLTEAHNNLGAALVAKGQLDEAIAACREALRLKKDYAYAHNILGEALKHKRQLDEAIAESREAIRLKKDFAEAHFNLGEALLYKGQVHDAIAEYREAIRLKKGFAVAHFGLGNALGAKGQLDEAIAALHEAIRHKKDFAEAHCNLGFTLRQQGRFVEALKAVRRGHELGSQRPNWPYPSAEWVKQFERLVALDDKLPDFLSGKVHPADTAERLALAELCQEHKKRYAAAARFYAEACAAEPKLSGDGPSGLRYNAACAAALAGCGQGQDAKSLGDKERAGLRRQALDWLQADLAAWRRLLEKESAKAGPAVMQQMQHWQDDADFAGVRGVEALGRLPAAERPDWQKLWQEVEDLRQRALAPARPDKIEKKAPPK